MLSRNLRGEMIAHLKGAKLTLSDSRFIQVIAKSLSISCKEVREPDSIHISFPESFSHVFGALGSYSLVLH